MSVSEKLHVNVLSFGSHTELIAEYSICSLELIIWDSFPFDHQLLSFILESLSLLLIDAAFSVAISLIVLRLILKIVPMSRWHSTLTFPPIFCMRCLQTLNPNVWLSLSNYLRFPKFMNIFCRLYSLINLPFNTISIPY